MTGSNPITASTGREAVPASDGISVAAMRSFYEEHVNDKNCTTADIFEMVKKLTKANPKDISKGKKDLSYCELLRQRQTATPSPSSPAEVGVANVFISHAWKYNFYEFLVALEAKFKGQPNVFLWIDIFSHNQHDELTSDKWITQFEQHIVRINRTVMIVFPWNNPIPFTRLFHLMNRFIIPCILYILLS